MHLLPSRCTAATRPYYWVLAQDPARPPACLRLRLRQSEDVSPRTLVRGPEAVSTRTLVRGPEADRPRTEVVRPRSSAMTSV